MTVFPKKRGRRKGRKREKEKHEEKRERRKGKKGKEWGVMLLKLPLPYTWWNISVLHALRNDNRSHRAQMFHLVEDSQIFLGIQPGANAIRTR